MSNGTNPTVIVILGATGDLSQKKLIPSLFDLFTKGYLAPDCTIIGFSRGQLTDEDFRNFMHKAIDARSADHRHGDMERFLGQAFYHRGNFDVIEGYTSLSERLAALDRERGQCTNKLFYLAVPPKYYEIIFRHIADSGLAQACSDSEGWTRVLVEKPFGRDMETARELDRLLGSLFKEEQIFRIDHYLARETLQNILTFRFSNTVFEPIWNNGYIEKVELRLVETIGVGMRGAFYEDIGALRDVGQNHLLQMLALIAMDHPGMLDASYIRRERARILSSLLIPTAEEVKDMVVRGQYEGFTEEKDVAPTSTTETYFRLTAFVDNDRWRGVPFVIESGKSLREKRTGITVHFKAAAPCFCPGTAHEHQPHANIFTFKIQPEEGIAIRFWAKKPGLMTEIEPRDLSFAYGEGASMKADAYERVLYDCIQGDQTLFVSTEEVQAAWAYISAILDNWGTTPLHRYGKGSDGPPAMKRNQAGGPNPERPDSPVKPENDNNRIGSMS